MLKGRWPTYSNTVSGHAVTFARAILLDALFQAAARDDRIAVAFVSLARNVLPYAEGGQEQPIWVDVVADMERRIDALAEAEWAAPSSIAAPKFRLEADATITPKIDFMTLNSEWITQQVAAAVGPSSGSPQPGGNPHTLQANLLPNWAPEFSSRLARLIHRMPGIRLTGVA